MNRFVAYAFFPVLIVFSYAPSQGAILGALEHDAQDQMARIKDLMGRMSPADKLELVRVLRADAGDLASSASVSAGVDSEVLSINQGRPAPGSCDGIQLKVPRTLHDAARLGDIDAAWQFLSFGRYAGGAHYNDRDDLHRTFIEVAAEHGNRAFVEHYLNDLEQNVLQQLQSIARRYKNKDLDPYYRSRKAADDLQKWIACERLKIEFMEKR